MDTHVTHLRPDLSSRCGCGTRTAPFPLRYHPGDFKWHVRVWTFSWLRPFECLGMIMIMMVSITLHPFRNIAHGMHAAARINQSLSPSLFYAH